MRLRILAVTVLAARAVAAAEDPLAGLPPVGEEARQALIALFKENRRKYGDDAAVMQGLLLVHANRSGAVLATESAIVVLFRVDSGTIFDDRSTSPEQRLEAVWHSILERTLLRYPSFRVPGDGIAVEILYSHRPFDFPADLYRPIDDRGVLERAKFYLSAADVSEFVAGRLGGREMLARSAILLDDRPVRPEVVDPVGPPVPDWLR
jgi:hypothetical protein